MAADNHNDIQARLEAVGAVYVSTPAINAARDLIDQTRTERREDGGACACLITGVSGMGKTTIFRKYEADEPKPADGTTMPVLLLSTATPFTPAAFWKGFLVKMMAPVPTGHTSVEDLITLVKVWLDRRKVELVLLEEVNHIVDRKARDAKIPYYVTDMIKMHLLDDAKVPLVMGGIPVAAELLRINPQLEMRSLDWIPLLPYDLKDPVSREQFTLLLEVFEVAAGFPRSYFANDPKLCDRVHWATGGIHGKITKLMKKATRIAAQRGADGLSSEILALACATGTSVHEGWFNPFLVERLPDAKLPDESRITKLTKRKSRGEESAA